MNLWLTRTRAGVIESPELPSPATRGSFGYDLAAAEDITILPQEVGLIPTGWALARDLPYEKLEYTNSTTPLTVRMAMLILPRSSLFKRHGLIIPNSPGLVDADYAGEIFVQVLNLRSESTTVRAGERVAQLVFTLVALPQLAMMEPDLARTRGGFGSTGA